MGREVVTGEVVYSALTTVSCPGLWGEQRRVLPMEWTFAGAHQSNVEGNMLFLINIFGSDSFFGPSAKATLFKQADPGKKICF